MRRSTAMRDWVMAFLLAAGAFGADVSVTQAQYYQGYGTVYPAYSYRRAEEIDGLVGPIALYPDAFLAEVLAACTYPDEVASAAAYLRAGRDPLAIDLQPWDASVRAVARHPDTLFYLAGRVDWMNDLGAAFLYQRADVMSSVQVLRARANAAGNLDSCPQQQVVVDGDVIQIIPANPQVIYVPVYDPAVVYVSRPLVVGSYWSPLVHFGIGVDIGVWLHLDLDWVDRTVYHGDWGWHRPWWEHDEHHGEPGHHYADHRPGRDYHPPDRGGPTGGSRPPGPAPRPTPHVEMGPWSHDAHKQLPRPSGKPGFPQPDRRAGTGYPPAGRTYAEPSRPGAIPPNDARGPVTSRQSARGRDSVQRSMPSAGVRPGSAQDGRNPPPRAVPTPAPTPARTPAPTPPASPKPSPPRIPPPSASRTPEARPSAPVRGGAVHGYQNGSSAAQSSDRGAASRKSAGQGGSSARRR